MKVLGAGFSRTGTKSLHRACKILGLRSIHFDKKFTELLQTAGSTNMLDLRHYDHIDAMFDTPPALFYREFLDRYPDLKVILSLRDEDAWWRSIRRNLETLPIKSPRDYSSGWRWPETTWYQRNLSFGSHHANEFLFRKRYREHNEAVRTFVPADQLLVMDLPAGDGWEKLCGFLDLPVPEEDFPWTR